tara:strand:+ start:949 stop:1431 length:483 start_codon:yes stop_codon:yes gene_type:complete
MRHIILLAILSMVNISYSQDLDHFVIGTDGGYAGNNQFSISYTIGEIVTELGNDPVNNIDLTQGFQQAYISIVSIEDHIPDIDISVFPNPAVNYLNVNISDLSKVKTYALFDMSGKLLKQQEIISNQLEISFSNFSSGNYLLIFKNEQQKLKTLKVQKSH